MKLGVVTTSFPREPGDPAGSFVASHVRWLEAQGHSVEVIAAGDRRAANPRGRSAEARAHRVASRLFYRGGAPEALERGGIIRLAAAAGFSLRQLAAIARRLHRWDAVCAHWLAPSAVAVAAARIARRDTTPFLAIAHSGDVHLLERLRLIAPIARLLVAGGAQISFSSGALAQRMIGAIGGDLGERLGERTLVCPMGVDVTAPAVDRRRPDTCQLLFLGRLVPIKGVDTLLAALARLGDRFELIVAGDGPERAGLERAAIDLGVAGRTRFVGEVRSLFRDSLLAGADVLVAPSRSVDGRTEGMPVAVLEAIASGTPAVVSDSGGLAELPDSVPKVSPDDPAALARVIAPLVTAEARDRVLHRQRPIAEAQTWHRVGATLWRHWIPERERVRRTA